jgi:hypothetical protein
MTFSLHKGSLCLASSQSAQILHLPMRDVCTALIHSSDPLAGDCILGQVPISSMYSRMTYSVRQKGVGVDNIPSAIKSLVGVGWIPVAGFVRLRSRP